MVLTEASVREENPRSIETALTSETAIQIISAQECDKGRDALLEEFIRRFPDLDTVSVVPVLRSGLRLGQELSEEFGVTLNPMRMSYYKDDDVRLEKPICLDLPDIDEIVKANGKTKHVVFTECVVDTQETILEAIRIINAKIDALAAERGQKIAHPTYHTFAYVSKTGDKKVEIPNLIAAFQVSPQIWVGGRGCDFKGDLARDWDLIAGYKSPFATGLIQGPYYTRNFTSTTHFNRHFTQR